MASSRVSHGGWAESAAFATSPETAAGEKEHFKHVLANADMI